VHMAHQAARAQHTDSTADTGLMWLQRAHCVARAGHTNITADTGPEVALWLTALSELGKLTALQTLYLSECSRLTECSKLTALPELGTLTALQTETGLELVQRAHCFARAGHTYSTGDTKLEGMQRAH
jgi:hypothetical protein